MDRASPHNWSVLPSNPAKLKSVRTKRSADDFTAGSNPFPPPEDGEGALQCEGMTPSPSCRAGCGRRRLEPQSNRCVHCPSPAAGCGWYSGSCWVGPGGPLRTVRCRTRRNSDDCAGPRVRDWGQRRSSEFAFGEGGRVGLVAEGLDLNIRKCRSCSGRGKAPAHVAPSRRAARGRRGLEPVPMPGLASDHCMVCTACSAVQPSRPWARSHGSGAEQAPQRSRSEWARVASPRGPCFSRWAGMAGSARRDRPGDSAARGLQRVASPWMPACSQLPLCSEGVEGAARRAGKSVDELWPDWICIGKHSIGLVWKSAHQETAASSILPRKKKSGPGRAGLNSASQHHTLICKHSRAVSTQWWWWWWWLLLGGIVC